MIQEEILKYNEICAIFLGYKNTTPTDKDFNIYEKENGEVGNLIETMSMKFHSDWNWVIKVIDTIEKLGYLVEISGNSERSFACISVENTDIPIIRCGYDVYLPKKEVVIVTINKFLNWYENK